MHQTRRTARRTLLPGARRLRIVVVVQKGRVLPRDIDAFSCETARISFLFCLKCSLLRVITDNAPAIAAAGFVQKCIFVVVH